MTEEELWDIEQVCEYIGGKTTRSAAGVLSRAGISAVAYKRSDAGRPMSLYPAAQVRALMAIRSGRGARTDLGATWPIMAVLPGSDLAHAARQAGEKLEVVTLCGLTGTPIRVNPESGNYCPDCHASRETNDQVP